MQDKILKPYTIIPSNLYVFRDADYQLRKVIEDMGRPGYILVARQMGKTNLLLNAKRELQDNNNIFVYLDLSNPFESPREYFRNIIDTAIETHEDTFSSAKKIIYDNRENQNLPEHREHTDELRTLLKVILGKLVIILDEIDILTKAKFSDQIFAQIRSTYFSRINFPEYERLTYILSGVIEPTEIIKDSKTSPFNIGQKIFLDDFSYSEFLNFIGKSQLKLSDKVIERVYYWAHGSPRITWDICSELEDYTHEDKEVDIGTVDDIINKLYLTHFDKAPVDHIRELVEDDNEIRNAVIEVKYQKGKTLSDSIKKKLYLAGITNSDFSSDQINIKNRVIEHSLSDQWLQDVEKKKKGILKLANEKYQDGNYKEALNLFEEYLKEHSFEEPVKNVYYDVMGHCCYKLGEYEKAIKYIGLGLYNKEGYSQTYHEQIYILGLCHFYNGEHSLSIKKFKEVVDSNKRDRIYFKSLLNLAIAYFGEDFNHYQHEILNIYKEILDEVDTYKEDFPGDEFIDFKTTLFYNIAITYKKLEEYQKAVKSFNQAIDICAIPSKPVIFLGILELYKIMDSKEDVLKTLSLIVENIIKNKLKPITYHPEKLLWFTQQSLNEVLIQAFALDRSGLFNEILNYVRTCTYCNKNTEPELLLNLAKFAINSNNREIGTDILLEIVELHKEEVHNDSILYNAYKLLSYLLKSNASSKYLNKYFEYFYRKDKPSSIDFLDFKIFADNIKLFIEKKAFKSAENLINIICSYYGTVDETLAVNYLVIYYLEMILNNSLGKKQKEIEKANETLKLISKLEFNSEKNSLTNSLLGEKGLEFIRDRANHVIKNPQLIPIVNKTPKIGRNAKVRVKYIDGSVKETKYKKVESEIENGLCTLIDVQN